MINENNDERVLHKNSIKKFILRVDLMKPNDSVVALIANNLTQYFDRLEKRQITGFTVNFTKGESEMSQQQANDFVLISEKQALSMTFSEHQNSFWLMCDHYQSNKVYKELLYNTIKTINEISSDIVAKRIGLRFINEFQCEHIKRISQIYGKRLASITKKMITVNKLSRVIGMEEYIYDDYKLRLQYGIPNKFYPSIISIRELLLDIDSYIDRKVLLNSWEGVVSQLNHNAYKIFSEEINPKMFEEMK